MIDTELGREYSLHLAQDCWDSPEIGEAWLGLIGGRRDEDVLGKSPELVDHMRTIFDPAQFHLSTVYDGNGAIQGVVPLRVMPSGLRIDIRGRVLWQSRSRVVNILGSLPLLPADPVPHDLLFDALDREFAACEGISLPSVPTESFLWQYIRDSEFLRRKFTPYLVHGVRGCHTIPLPSTVEEY